MTVISVLAVFFMGMSVALMVWAVLDLIVEKEDKKEVYYSNITVMFEEDIVKDLNRILPKKTSKKAKERVKDYVISLLEEGDVVVIRDKEE